MRELRWSVTGVRVRGLGVVRGPVQAVVDLHGDPGDMGVAQSVDCGAGGGPQPGHDEFRRGGHGVRGRELRAHQARVRALADRVDAELPALRAALSIFFAAARTPSG